MIMGTVLTFGSILLNETYSKPGAEYQPGQSIGFGQGNDLRWIMVNDLLIADQTLLVNISWNDLDQQDFVFGKPVTLNGQQFLCRLLKVGAENGAPNEWDSALDMVDDEDCLWHWDKISFWGQEKLDFSNGVYRGSYLPRFWNWFDTAVRSPIIGFRPALEPVPSDHLASGEQVCAIGGQSVLYGKLLEVTDYDALVKPEDGFKPVKADIGKRYTKLQDGTFIIDRTRMTVQSTMEKK